MAHPVKSLPHAERLKIAHSALNRVKSKFSVEDYEETERGIVVSYYDQFDNWFEKVIAKSTLISFILDFYSSVVNAQAGGEHFQYEDTRSADYYLDENIKEVLSDYLNNRRA